jgi:hypothetical protein
LRARIDINMNMIASSFSSATEPISSELNLDMYRDASLMQSLLQKQLPGFAEARLRIDALEISKVRRNTSRRRNPCPMTLCYTLQVSDLAQGRTGTQMLYAKVFHDNLAESFYEQQHRAGLVTPAFGEAFVLLRELKMVIWALPNDPDLPQLATLLNITQVGQLLPWAAIPASQHVSHSNMQIELLRYEPQARATLRYTLQQTQQRSLPHNDSSEQRVLYAKTFCDNRARDIHDRFDYFWQRAQTDFDAPLVAQPLGFCATTKTLWQASAPGKSHLQSIDQHNGREFIGRVARALAQLHNAPLALAHSATPRSVMHWVTEARLRQKRVSRIDPLQAARVTRVADAVAAHAVAQGARPMSLIHGDFHPAQIWVHEGRIVLFDFDEFTLGDPMEDLAAFVLKLEQIDTIANLSSTFIEAYAACAPDRFDQLSLNWHLTVQSLVQMSRAFTFQQPGWREELARRLARGEALAAALNKESA